jgi:hypothetical protein
MLLGLVKGAYKKVNQMKRKVSVFYLENRATNIFSAERIVVNINYLIDQYDEFHGGGAH